MLKARTLISLIWRRPFLRIGLVLVGLALAGAWFATRGSKANTTAPTFAARRGPLEITVLEGGSLQALESQEIKCQVRVGRQGTKILKIVDEGYLVTDEDVKNRKVLVELDSSDLQQQITQQEIQYQSALASLIDAQQNFEIQLRQNGSDVLAAERNVRFARMDFDKFLGADVTARVVKDCGLEAMMAASATNDIDEAASEIQAGQRSFSTNSPNSSPTSLVLTNRGSTLLQTASNSKSMQPAGSTHGTPTVVAEEDTLAPVVPMLQIEFSKYADISVLGDGEAKQTLRKFEDDLQVSRKELGQATTTLEGTKRLFDKGFVTRNDMERDEIAFENSRLKVQTAETARSLFIKYDFPKQAEQALSKYADSVRELDKARRVAVSKLAQARARLSSAQGQHDIQLRQKQDLSEQLAQCTIVAEKPGLVVYGGGKEEYYGGEERIREGATLRERQSIITIPDMSRMGVDVKVHESYINKVKKGEKARITVDAFADIVLTGEVTKVSVLPDSQNRWINPDLKVYNATVTIDGNHAWAKPGMSAKVEILVSEIPDCVYVPLQAINTIGNKQVCYVARGSGSELRDVILGEFNDDFIQIRKGLQKGDRVYLRPPSGAETGLPDGGEPKPGGGNKPAAPQSPLAAAEAAKS